MKRPDDRHAMNGNTADARLALQAMSYVLGELPPSDQEAFEVRLIDDQLVREAVVDAVRVCEAMTRLEGEEDLFPASLEFSKRTSVQTGTDRFFAWGAVALAASVMAAVVVAGLNRAPSMVASGNTDPQARLALAWASTPSVSDTSDETSETKAIGSDDAGILDELGNEEDAATSDVFRADDSDVPPADSNVPAADSNWFYEALTASRERAVSPSTAPVIRGET